MRGALRNRTPFYRIIRLIFYHFRIEYSSTLFCHFAVIFRQFLKFCWLNLLFVEHFARISQKSMYFAKIAGVVNRSAGRYKSAIFR